MTHRPYFSEEYARRSGDALDTGLEKAPVYSSWKLNDPGKNFPVDERYSAMPELTKKEIRDNFPDGLVPGNMKLDEGLKRGEVEYVQTSGTTSEKVTNIWNQEWWNASEAASWKLNAHTEKLDHSHREAQLASSLSVGEASESDLPVQKRILDDRILFLNEKKSVLDWTDHHYKRMIGELEEFRPVFLEANPSLLARLAWWALDHDKKIYSPEVVIFTYEFVTKIHCNIINQVFSCPLVSSFGSTEAGYILMQCEHGTYHQNSEFCRIDYKPLKPAHGGPYIGRLLVTTFNNPWASLIRFDTGDLIRLKDDFRCKCGRCEGYMISAIEGRSANATFTTSGRLVTTKEADDSLYRVPGIRDYQIRQTTGKEYGCKLIIRKDKKNTIGDAEKTLRRVYGDDAVISIEICSEIEPSASGKYRRTQALFDFSQKDIF